MDSLITYPRGGLEDKMIHFEVCQVLEGGEPDFQRRARRMEMKIDRLEHRL